MNQSDLTERLDVLQAQLMAIYEENPTDLQSQIKHQLLLRKEAIVQYYARKEGYDRLGLQHIPALKISEYHAKTAIKMMLLLESLAKSPYASETWTLPDTSADRFNSPPRNCFKKHSYEVEVWFDNDRKNAFPYINWRDIYYQDEDDKWHKVQGKVDYNGLYFDEIDGTRTYFVVFSKDADRYGSKNIWTVNYDNEQIVPSVTSSARRPSPISEEVGESSTTITAPKEKTNRRGSIHSEEGNPSSTTRIPPRRRRRGGGEQGEQAPSKRQRRAAESDRESDFVSASEVGTSNRSVPRTGLGRVERLKAEAKDPPIIILQGGANSLKCWRHRCRQKYKSHFLDITTVFKWVENDIDSRLLVAFANKDQRSAFIALASIPKGVSLSLGSLESL
ncbi:E2 [Human papillomavirus 171]|uniref:Regulatory protein E2 n=1 Tax=Human papillomavirus 171 TaxID=1434986 RepID=V5W3V3_9PAPI|nr:E2 [Human papillomavirus 171]